MTVLKIKHLNEKADFMYLFDVLLIDGTRDNRSFLASFIDWQSIRTWGRSRMDVCNVCIVMGNG